MARFSGLVAIAKPGKDGAEEAETQTCPHPPVLLPGNMNGDRRLGWIGAKGRGWMNSGEQ